MCVAGCVGACLCVCVCACVHMYLCVCVCVHMYLCVCAQAVNVCVSTQVMHMFAYVGVQIFQYIFLNV